MGLMALAIACVQINLQAQESEEVPARSQAATTKPKTLPFHGTLKSLDKQAGTVKVGNRTFKLSADSRFLQGSLEEAKIGDKVGGSYWKANDGTLMVNSIRFGPKPGKASKETPPEE
jgi:hypothetical protein